MTVSQMTRSVNVDSEGEEGSRSTEKIRRSKEVNFLLYNSRTKSGRRVKTTEKAMLWM